MVTCPASRNKPFRRYWKLGLLFLMVGALADCRCGKDEPTVVEGGAQPVDSGQGGGHETAKSPKHDAGIDIAVYRKALAAGRTATRKKDYPLAIRDFDDALIARPDDGRVLAERGFAKLQAADYDGADADLQRAITFAGKDKRLKGQIWFNLGLVAEGRHDDGAAYDAFQASNAANPSEAAKAKIVAGKGKESSLCGVRADLKRAPLTHGTAAAECIERCGSSTFRFTDGVTELPDAGLPCAVRCGATPTDPYVAKIGDELALVIPGASGYDSLKLMDAAGGRCGVGMFEFEVEKNGAFIHVHMLNHFPTMTMLCESDDGDVHACSNTEERTVGDGCSGETAELGHDIFVDRIGKLKVAEIEELEPEKAPAVTTNGVGLVFHGPTCDRTLPWPK
jgi:hypothetical protein